MNIPPENPPPPVPVRAQQGGEASVRKVPAEPAVWTERMLTALVTGLKGNRWFRLIDKVYRAETLQLAWEKVRSNAGGSGVDGITVGRFAKDCPRRAGKRGRGRGSDHQQWRNHYFAKRGLFSLVQAHAETLISLRHGATH